MTRTTTSAMDQVRGFGYCGAAERAPRCAAWRHWQDIGMRFELDI